MQYQIENVTPVKKRLVVTVPADEVEASILATIAMYKDKVDVPGFRKGHVPMSMIESKYKKRIIAEASEELVNVHIHDILSETGDEPISRIDFEPGGEFDRGKEYIYHVVYEVLPPAGELPDYVGRSVEEEEPTVNETEVEAVFERMREQLAEFKPIDEHREPVDGEVVVVSFKAFMDGKPLEGIAADNFQLELGKGQALPEFEAGVKTMKPREEKEFSLTFPADFLNESLAGKTADVKTTLHAVKFKELPPLDDELAKKAGGRDSLDAMRADIKKSYIESRTQLNKAAAQKRLLDELVKEAVFTIPPSIVERHLSRMINETVGRLERQGKSFESLGKSLADLKAEFAPEAEELGKLETFLLIAAKKEGMTVQEPELDAFFKLMAARTGEEWSQLKRWHIEQNLIVSVRDRILADKAMEHIYSKADVKKIAPAAA